MGSRRGAGRCRPAWWPLPGSASRLLTRLDPRVVARGLLEQLDAVDGRRSYVDLIPLFYAAELLQGLGHPGSARRSNG